MPNPERTSYVYFGIFLLIAIFGGWAIWQGTQWREATERKEVFPSVVQTSEEESVVYGRRGKIRAIDKDFLIMDAKVNGIKRQFTVRRKKGTRLWYVFLGDNFTFAKKRWKDLAESQNVYAIATEDIADKIIFEADRIYIIADDGTGDVDLPDILGEESVVQ